MNILLKNFTFHSPKLAELDSCMVTLTAIAESVQLKQHDRFYQEECNTHSLWCNNNRISIAIPHVVRPRLIPSTVQFFNTILGNWNRSGYVLIKSRMRIYYCVNCTSCACTYRGEEENRVNHLFIFAAPSKLRTPKAPWPLVHRSVKTTMKSLKRASILKSSWSCTPSTRISPWPRTSIATTWRFLDSPITFERHRRKSWSTHRS